MRSEAMMMRVGWVSVLGAMLLTGCAVEHPKSRAEKKAEKTERKEDAALTPHPMPPVRVDEADAVLQACGRPASDQTLAIYDKLDHGPLRRLVYRGRQAVRLEFVPSVGTYPVEPGKKRVAPPERLPGGAVWMFSEARMESEELLTSKRLAVYLPCAAKALQPRE